MVPPRIRRVQNLKRLIDERYDGYASHLARDVGIHPSYVGNMLASLRGTKGAKPLTEAMAERIEQALELEPGELSRDPEAEPAPIDSSRQGALFDLLRLIETQGRSATEGRGAMTELRDSQRGLIALLELMCAVFVTRDPKLAPLMSEVTRRAATQAEAEGSDAFRELAESLSRYCSALPPSLEDAARLAAKRAASPTGERLA